MKKIRFIEDNYQEYFTIKGDNQLFFLIVYELANKFQL